LVRKEERCFWEGKTNAENRGRYYSGSKGFLSCAGSAAGMACCLPWLRFSGGLKEKGRFVFSHDVKFDDFDFFVLNEKVFEKGRGIISSNEKRPARLVPPDVLGRDWLTLPHIRVVPG